MVRSVQDDLEPFGLVPPNIPCHEMAPRSTKIGAAADCYLHSATGRRPAVRRPVGKSNLRGYSRSFVGRESEILEAAALLRDHPLVTLTGSGGIGKTRLALEVARMVGNRYDDGVWFIDLAAVRDQDLVADTVRASLSREVVGVSRSIDLVDLLRHCEMLLVFDNCEHLTGGCAALVGRLMSSCPDLSVLATSRHRLGVPGEQVWSLRPLQLPGQDDLDTATLAEVDAVKLFVDRARAVRPDFRLTAKVAWAVAQICRRLDGLPLAIELAAARLAVLSPDDIVSRLDDRFRLLRSPMGTHRHQTLEATFDWSHELLSAKESTLARRLSVFTGGWNLIAAEAVCSGDGVSPEDVLDLLEALLAKSLVIADRDGSVTRYRMLESIRCFAQSKLESSGEMETLRTRHAGWCQNLAREAAKERLGRHHDKWRQAIEDDQDNIREALAWARSREQVDDVLELAADMTWFWECKGQLREGLDWLNWAVSRSGGRAPELVAKALRGTGMLRWLVGDVASAVPLVDQSLRLFQKAGDEFESTGCVCSMAMHMFDSPAQSLPALHDHLAHMQSSGDLDRLAHALVNCGVAHFFAGEADAARHCFEECLLLPMGRVDPLAASEAHFGLGRVRLLHGDLVGSETQFRIGLDLAVRATDPDGRSTALSWIGEIARIRGDYQRARSLLCDALELVADDGPALSVARCKQFQARLALSEGALPEAKLLYLDSLAKAAASVMPYHRVRCLLGLGETATATGDFSQADAFLAESLEVAQAHGDMHAVGQAVGGLAMVAQARNDSEQAMRLRYKALEVQDQIGDQLGLLASLDSLAALALDVDRTEFAVRLLAAAEAGRRATGAMRVPAVQREIKATIERAVACLSANSYQDAWDQGSKMTPTQATSYAIRGRGSKMRPSQGWDSLSRAERDLLKLVIEGMTNQEISEKLFVSLRTVTTHLTHIFHKVGVATRRELVREASQRSPIDQVAV